METACQRGVDQILCRATEADEQVVIVGIDDGGSTREIREDGDRRSASMNFQGCVLWLDAASVAWRTKSRS
jgi:hypothetical protein